MSRIDEALKRLSGAVSPDLRQTQVLDRFASEGEISRVDAVQPIQRVESRKRPTVVPGPHPVTERPPAAQAPPDSIAPRRRPSPEVEREEDAEKLIDARQVADYAGFVLRSVGRHKLVVLGTFVLAFLLVVAAALLMPKTYHVEVKMLAQRNAVMTALSNPGRAVPWDADAPTRAAAETVLRRDNLISLIAQTNLINEWDRRRAPIVRFKDWVRAVVTRHQPTEDEKLDALVWRLENYMFVTAGPVGDGTVTIDLYWPDGETAYLLVERARQAFIEARQVAETSAISESIAILERYSASLHEGVSKTITEMQKSQPRDRTDDSSRAPRPVRRLAVPSTTAPTVASLIDEPAIVGMAPNPEASRLKVQLSQKRQELTRIEQERQRQISELQAKLSAALTIYTSTHPTVVSLQSNLAALQHESPQLVTLKNAIEELETKYDDLTAADEEHLIQSTLAQRAATPAARPPAPAPRDRVVSDLAPAQPAAPRPTQFAEFAGLRLKTELNQLQSIIERTDGARIELAVSEAAFKYRYTVIKPAQVPREPDSPNMRLVLLLGFVAAAGLAVGVVVIRDLMSNRILEPWQVERQLGLPILGTARL